MSLSLTLTLTLPGGLGSISTELQGRSKVSRTPAIKRTRRKRSSNPNSNPTVVKAKRVRAAPMPTNKIKDKDIRAQFHKEFTKRDHGKGSVVIDEFNIGDSIRADIVIASNHLYGLEIKSEADKLDRLPNQVLGYDHTCSRPGIIVHESHLAGAKRIISPWWDIYVASGSIDKVIIEHERKGWVSEKLRPYTVFDIMWRRELILEHKQRFPRNHPLHRTTFEKVRASQLLLELSRDVSIELTIKRITKILKDRALSGEWTRSYFIL